MVEVILEALFYHFHSFVLGVSMDLRTIHEVRCRWW